LPLRGNQKIAQGKKFRPLSGIIRGGEIGRRRLLSFLETGPKKSVHYYAYTEKDKGFRRKGGRSFPSETAEKEN